MAQITIPDSFYQEAAQAIADERRKNEGTISAQPIEKVLRSYVFLGVNKKIVDFSSLLSDSDQEGIVTAVNARTRDVYSLAQSYGTTLTNLEILENLSLNGLASPNVARPRAAEEAYEAQLVDAHKNDPSVIAQGVQNFFGVVKAGLESALKGLGIDIPIEILIGLAALLVIVLLTGRARAA